METPVEIKYLDHLLQLFFKSDLKITHCVIKRLTAAGENYGSLMLQVELKLKDVNGSMNEEETFHLVAKMCPPNEWLKKMFHTEITFKKEIALYETIIPLLKSLQIEQGASQIINCIPKCYGARISLNPQSDMVDDDAVILLENLKLQQFQIMDRIKGLDLNVTKLLIRNLAIFHAAIIGIKLLKPVIFKQKILPHLNQLCLFNSLSKETEELIIKGLIDTAETNKECIPYLCRAKNSLLENLNNIRNPKQHREPFSTIVHNDFWVNNAMIKFEGDKPVKCKIVDFQLIEYGSPGNDIVFLLFSSVKKEVLDEHYDSLIKLYYEEFINTLKDLKCDVTPFTYNLFEEEINASAKDYQFLHTMVMLRPIFTVKGTVKELDELSEDELLRNDTLADEYKQKVCETVLQFARRGWI